jgi:hypothetical protein
MPHSKAIFSRYFPWVYLIALMSGIMTLGQSTLQPKPKTQPYNSSENYKFARRLESPREPTEYGKPVEPQLARGPIRLPAVPSAELLLFWTDSPGLVMRQGILIVFLAGLFTGLYLIIRKLLGGHSKERPQRESYQSLPAAYGSPVRSSATEASAKIMSDSRISESDYANTPRGGGWDPVEERSRSRDSNEEGDSHFTSPSQPEMSPDDRFIFQGIVRDFHEHKETASDEKGSSTVWDFVVDAFDARGNRLSPIPVQMFADDEPFEGFIRDGHTVGFYDQWKPGQTLHPNRVFNKTINSIVEAKTTYTPQTKVTMIVLVCASFLIFLVCGFLSVNTRTPVLGFLGFVPFLLMMFGLAIFQVIKKSRQ